MVCLDTTFLADLIRKNPDATRKLSELMQESKSLSTTIINVAELFYGAYKAKNLETEKAKLKLVINQFIVFEMDEKGAERFGEILAKLDRTGQKIAERDVMIASIALSRGERTIVTRNKKDFEKISDLTIATY
jgi:tRNA(fMet)-specific endonuclease VapC